MKNLLKTHKLITHKTNEGEMMPIYNDWQYPNHEVKMAYVTTIAPGVTKGPILHLERDGFMVGVAGELCVEVQNVENEEIISVQKEYLCLGNEKQIIEVPAGVPITITNTSSTVVGMLVNLPNKSWKPDNEDTYKFNSWRECFEFLQR